MKSALVTGGAGFIGKHLVHSLLDTEFRTTVVDRIDRPRSLPKSKLLSYHKIEVHHINSMDIRSLRNSAIIHLAAETSVQESVKHPLSTVKSNVETTCAALEFARKLDCTRFVFASTAAVYGGRNGRCRESDAPAPASPYAVSKLASEYYCTMYSRLYGLPTVILRYFNVYGPGQSNQYAGVITRFITLALQGKPPVIFGDGKQTRDFVYVEDIVKATLDSLSKNVPNGTIMNIGTGKPVTITSLAENVLRILGVRSLHPIRKPPRSGDIRHSQADISLARRYLNFKPSTDLIAGLRTTAGWFLRTD